MTHYCIKYRIVENYESYICICINADGMNDLLNKFSKHVYGALQKMDDIKEMTITESQVVKN